MNPIRIGINSYINADRILLITPPKSAPIKRDVSHAKDINQCIEATLGKQPRSIIYLDNGYIATSVYTPENLFKRTREANGLKSDD